MAGVPLDPVLQALIQNRMSPVLYETWGIQIRRFIAGRLRKPDDHSDVGDCVQETFLGTYRALNNKSDEELTALFPGLEKYLYETAAHAIGKFYQKNSRILQIQQKGQGEGGEKAKIFVLSLDTPGDNVISDFIDENAENPELTVERTEFEEEITAEVESILAALPEKDQEILRLRYLESDDIQPVASIALQLSKLKGTVKSDLSRATQKAKDYVRARKILQETGEEGKVACSLLPSLCREVILLHFYANASWDEIAVQCRCTVDRAKQHLHRGTKLLLHHWKV